MNYVFHPEAESEFFDAINYFEEQVEGMGNTFSREIFFTIRKITYFPFAWTLI